MNVFKNFINDFRTTIETGLDNIIEASLVDLKEQLKLLLDKEIRNLPETTAESATKENINIPKSDEAVIEHLTGLDIKKINIKKDYKSAIDSNVCPVTRDKKGDPIVRVKIKVGPSDTLENLFAQARKFFNESLYVIPNRDGSTSVKLNTGFNLDKWVKIVCSTEKGLTDLSEARYAKTWQPKGEVEFTLKQEALKRFVEPNNGNFLDLTSVISKIKNNEIDIARQALQNIKETGKLASSTTVDKLIEQTDKLSSKTGLTKDITEYYDILALIDNIHVEKTVHKEVILYHLKTSTSADRNKIQDFFIAMTSKINLWLINHEVKWFQQFKDKVQNLIDKYMAV